MKRKAWVILITVLLAVVFGACSAKTAQDNSAAAPQAVENERAAAAAKPEDANRKIIVNANAALRVESLSAGMDALDSLTKELGGYTRDSYLDEDSGRLSSMIPADNLDIFLGRLDKLGKVVNKSKTSQDVTDTYFDTQTRIKNLEAEIETMRKLLQKEGWKVSELLEIEREIRRLTDELELLKGQMTNLDRSIKYSQVDINLILASTGVQTGSSDDFGYRIKTSFKSGIGFLTATLAALASFAAFMLPLLPIGLILYIIWRKLVKPYLEKKKRNIDA